MAVKPCDALRRRARLPLLALAAAVLGGCGLSRYEPPHFEDAPVLRDRLAASIASAYPPAFKLTQRIVLQAGGKEYDFIGYLRVRRGAGFRAMALGEMGGVIFDIQFENGRARILRKPDAMPEEPLLEGVVGDILHLFDPPRPAAGAGAVGRHAQDASARLYYRIGPRRAVEYEFPAGAHGPARSLDVRDGRIERVAHYDKYRSLPGSSQPVPGRIRLENLRLRYTLEIDLIKMEPLPADAP